MRTLIVTEFISLDGVMEAPGGEEGYAHSGWVAPHFTPELGAYKEAEQLATDVLLLGRTTYDGFYGAWPQRDGAMADKINTMTKVVASTTLGSSDWQDTTVVASDLEGAVRDPAQAAGGFEVRAGLVDELHLQVFPVLLGSGARLFPDTDTPIALTLSASEAMPNGVLAQTYAVG